jgi:enoyl-CoA hydratase/carnithine racemase
VAAPEPELLRDLTDGVLLLSFNRPDRNNAWTIGLENAYFDALIEAAGDPAVRVIVVTGVGRAFCPGMDTDVLMAAVGGVRADVPRRPMTLARRIPKPVIAAVNGACAGIGFIQACAADLRFAARGAKLTTSFVRRGLPAENSLSWLLPRMIGAGRAADLLLSGRVILAEEAHAMGLVEHLCEPDELLPAALAYAGDLAANCSPRSMEIIKQQLQLDWEGTAEASRMRAIELVASLATGADFGEGVRSYTEKRPPRFEGVAVTVEVEGEWIRKSATGGSDAPG